jgi:YD repeat-containing protein
MTVREEQARATALARATAARQRARSFKRGGVPQRMQYDEAGLPVEQRRLAFAARVRRLIIG